ncbi:MAG: hypothetical protein K6F50_04115 [Kiritimatiellae bacterium]|nr:hypothetical protein [Kiritimatiellia bacterium]
MKKAFTLLEVNLAILIMAGGVLSVIALYGLGQAENRQSREDVAAAAYADAVLSPLVMALSSTNLDWQTFNSVETSPSALGWGAYISQSSGLVEQDPTGRAKSVYSSVMNKVGSKAGVNTAWPSVGTNLKPGLVVIHDEDSGVVRIAFRATDQPTQLMAMPIFYTEVRFQGKTETAANGGGNR